MINAIGRVAILSGMLLPMHAFGQGCILTRSTAPVLGSQSSPTLEAGNYELGLNFRHFKADEQYSGGSGLNPVVMNTHTQVISEMYYSELSALYAWSQQLHLTANIPIILDASSNRALPAGVVGSPRFEQSSSGVGDITFGARYWLFNFQETTDKNIGLGFSLKAPTGDSMATDQFPNAAGNNITTRVVDQSIQPGDGGWGFIISFEAFKAIGDFTLFASGSYLFNPDDQNDTYSPRSMLSAAGPSAIPANVRYNTISDSYIARAGAAYPIAAIPGLSVSLAARIVGVPHSDAFGDSIGFRRPGYYVTLDPGLLYTRGKATFSVTVPTRVHQYVGFQYGVARDSTYADYLVEFSASYRFGE